MHMHMHMLMHVHMHAHTLTAAYGMQSQGWTIPPRYEKYLV